jgi:hypothetical protein
VAYEHGISFKYVPALVALAVEVLSGTQYQFGCLPAIVAGVRLSGAGEGWELRDLGNDVALGNDELCGIHRFVRRCTLVVADNFAPYPGAPAALLPRRALAVSAHARAVRGGPLLPSRPTYAPPYAPSPTQSHPTPHPHHTIRRSTVKRRGRLRIDAPPHWTRNDLLSSPIHKGRGWVPKRHFATSAPPRRPGPRRLTSAYAPRQKANPIYSFVQRPSSRLHTVQVSVCEYRGHHLDYIQCRSRCMSTEAIISTTYSAGLGV